MSLTDVILVKNLSAQSLIGNDGWERTRKQPLTVSLRLEVARLDATARSDALDDPNSVSYSTVAKHAVACTEASKYKSVETLAAAICLRILAMFGAVESVETTLIKPRALLHATGAGAVISRTRQDYQDLLGRRGRLVKDDLMGDAHWLTYRKTDSIFICDLTLSTIIGINPWERGDKQLVVVNLTVYPETARSGDYVARASNFRILSRAVSAAVEASAFRTAEALAYAILKVAIVDCGAFRVRVRVEKPSALLFAKSAGIEMERSRQDFAAPDASHTRLVGSAQEHHALIALGSNMGDRPDNLWKALQFMDTRFAPQDHTVGTILKTSFLYETPPMYVTDQPRFLNAVCLVRTSLDPQQLLHTLKRIENTLGRTKEIRNGPRCIDLDIIAYDQIDIATESLVIPHPRIGEREFVLRPLCDIDPDWEHPVLQQSARQLLSQLLFHKQPVKASDDIMRVFPISRNDTIPIAARTHVMGILNITPDSFSDGGIFTDANSAVQHAISMVQRGADVIDVGGQSTRPGAESVSEDDEAARVVPVIETIRRADINASVSVDTFSAKVAELAIKAGADIINDVTGGRKDPNIINVAARFRTPICLMHMRGDPKTMSSLDAYSGDIVASIRQELSECVQAAVDAGIPRWAILVDPGLGFAKNAKQNYEILRRLGEFASDAIQDAMTGMPVLVGPSRKRFLAKSPDQVPSERLLETAAACAAIVAGGGTMVRVHDVAEVADALRVADNVWRD